MTTFRDYIKDARLELFAFFFGMICWAKFVIERARDRLNGDVDVVLASFDKTKARLERAAQVAEKNAARSYAAADHYDELANQAEEAAESFTAQAERAKRVNERIAKLLD